MRGWRVTLALCVAVVGVTCAVQPNPRARRSVAVNTEGWRNLIAEYARGGGGGGGGGGWFPPPFPVQVPLQAVNSGSTSMQVLVVPVPVPVPAPRADAQCRLDAQQAPAAPPDYSTPPRAVPDVPSNIFLNSAYSSSSAPTTSTPTPPTSPRPTTRARPAPFSMAPDKSRPTPPPPRQPPPPARAARDEYNFPPVEDSRLLVEQFRAQVATDPTRPPVGIEPVDVVSADDYTVDQLKAKHIYTKATVVKPPPDEQSHRQASPGPRRLKCERRRLDAASSAHASPPPPPRPRFERSLFLRARLTVPRAGYTESYSVWWDAASGASRVDFHGGTTSSYRMMKRDGRVQSVKISVDRTSEADVRRCVVSAPRRVSLAERALPALPDLQAFSFAGYVYEQERATLAERWRYTVSGHSGELGGARGEALTFRHELLVVRAPDNFTTTPLWYSVRVDSSVLGADSDGYVHYFDEVQPRHHDTAMFQLDIADACEQVEITNRMEIVEPLREFTMLRRDPRYDAEVEQYRLKHERIYADDLEGAVRTNVYIQSNRYVSSGNRQGATFVLEINFLSDRLDVEVRFLLGVRPTPGADPGEPFPHSRAELEALRGRLPKRFSWRAKGAVTPVRNQLQCASCWAFATVAAVEGALFVKSSRLVPLSEQVLVDCAGPYEGMGCNASWPSSAYGYIRSEGVPARDQYTPFQGEVLPCRADAAPPVARISGYYNVTVEDILALKLAIKMYGPTVVITDAAPRSFLQYKSGFYHDSDCRRDTPNHAMLAVGWTTFRRETYFIIKNSWGTKQWSEDGYVNIRANTDTCGVLRHPSVPYMRRSDVLRVPAGAPAASSL